MVGGADFQERTNRMNATTVQYLRKSIVQDRMFACAHLLLALVCIATDVIAHQKIFWPVPIWLGFSFTYFIRQSHSKKILKMEGELTESELETSLNPGDAKQTKP
jgi:hypothetical protein